MAHQIAVLARISNGYIVMSGGESPVEQFIGMDVDQALSVIREVAQNYEDRRREVEVANAEAEREQKLAQARAAGLTVEAQGVPSLEEHVRSLKRR